MQSFSARIQSFRAEEFVALMMKKWDQGQDLKQHLLISRVGINNGNFIHECCVEFERFSQTFSYSIENLEKFYGVRFCEVRKSRSGQSTQNLCFENGAKFGSDVIYVNTIRPKDRAPVVNYVRLSKESLL